MRRDSERPRGPRRCRTNLDDAFADGRRVDDGEHLAQVPLERAKEDLVRVLQRAEVACSFARTSSRPGSQRRRARPAARSSRDTRRQEPVEAERGALVAVNAVPLFVSGERSSVAPVGRRRPEPPRALADDRALRLRAGGRGRGRGLSVVRLVHELHGVRLPRRPRNVRTRHASPA